MRDSEIKHCHHRESIVMPKQQKLGTEEKVKIIQEYLSRKIGMCEAARMAGVNQTTMGQWVRNYKVDGIVWYSLWHNNAPRLLSSISYCLTNGGQFTLSCQPGKLYIFSLSS